MVIWVIRVTLKPTSINPACLVYSILSRTESLVWFADIHVLHKVVKRDMVTATAAVSALGCFFMGILTNLPVAIASVLPPPPGASYSTDDAGIALAWD